MNNKNLMIPGAILFGFVLLTAGTILAMNMFAFRIGIVDYSRLSSDNNKLYKQYTGELKSKQAELQTKFKNAKTDAEKNNINNEYQQYQSDKQKEVMDKIQKLVAQIAKKKGIKAVASSQVYIYGEIDLTDEVLKECNK